MRRARRVLSLIALTGLAAFTLVGCSELPTAPRSEEAAQASTSNPLPASATASISSIVDDVTGLIVKTVELVGSVGASVTGGRWTVVLPPSAVDGNGSVTLATPSATSSICQLEITPADKNHFNVPATLRVDCRGVPIYRLARYVILWHDPSTGAWVPVKGSGVDLAAGTVSAPLQHFSQYKVDTKAGW